MHLGDYLKLSHGEELSGGRTNPQLLANTYEALLGAVYLDQGLEKATQMVYETLLPLFEQEAEEAAAKEALEKLN